MWMDPGPGVKWITLWVTSGIILVIGWSKRSWKGPQEITTRSFQVSIRPHKVLKALDLSMAWRGRNTMGPESVLTDALLGLPMG